MELLIIAGVDITHIRLIDLTQLADQARPFYDWTEIRFQAALDRPLHSLNTILLTTSQAEIQKGIHACYYANTTSDLPFLFNGMGVTYPHFRACYYFFSWLIRDATQQRLSPLIQRILRNSGQSRIEAEIEVLSALIYSYRDHVKTFSWEAVREVIIDRLEGSRRSLKGHEKETVVRKALLTAIQSYFSSHGDYGVYAGVEIAERQIKIGVESYDVSVSLLDENHDIVRRILVPIKTQETEGGGHSHLFSCDITSAISAARHNNPEDYLMVIIVAKNWSVREAASLSEKVDHLVVFSMNPGEFNVFGVEQQEHLNMFIDDVLAGVKLP